MFTYMVKLSLKNIYLYFILIILPILNCELKIFTLTSLWFSFSKNCIVKFLSQNQDAHLNLTIVKFWGLKFHMNLTIVKIYL